jgi:hypothetical protein
MSTDRHLPPSTGLQKGRNFGLIDERRVPLNSFKLCGRANSAVTFLFRSTVGVRFLTASLVSGRFSPCSSDSVDVRR